MQNSKNGWFAAAAAALLGLLVCLSLIIITGGEIAWDSNLYYFIGTPVMTFLAYMLGYSFPESPWRWVVCMALGQFGSVIFVEDAMEFWWLTLGFLLMVSIPQFVSAYIGSNVAWNRSRPKRRM